LSLLLKLNPLVTELSLYDVVNAPGVSAQANGSICVVLGPSCFRNVFLVVFDLGVFLFLSPGLCLAPHPSLYSSDPKFHLIEHTSFPFTLSLFALFLSSFFDSSASPIILVSPLVLDIALGLGLGPAAVWNVTTITQHVDPDIQTRSL